MDTNEITEVLSTNINTKHAFKGVYACNRLPYTKLIRPALIVANLDPSDSSGSHWINFYLPEYEETVEMFNSIPDEISNFHFINFIARNGGLGCTNTQPLQSLYSDVCGEYVCVFGLFRCMGISMRETLSHFSSNASCNDSLVVRLFDKYFDCPRRRKDHTSVTQCCSPRFCINRYKQGRTKVL